MNENEQDPKNQNNELVQNPETNSQNLDIQDQKATPPLSEVAFSGIKEDAVEPEKIIEPEIEPEKDFEWNTVKIEDSNIGYNYINNSHSDLDNSNEKENIGIEKTENKKKFDFRGIFKNKWFYIISVLLLSVIFFIIVINNIMSDNKTNTTKDNKQTEQKTTITQQPQESNLVRRKIDGVLVSKDEANNWPFAAIIENSVDARPLSGVNDANIVYEALAEGSITRFLCIFSGSENISKIGPIRSARPYYVDIADEYNSLFVHFGGSPEALDRLSKGYYNVTDLNGIIYDGTYFWRDNNRVAPHNAYTSTDLINKYKSDTGKDKWFGDFSEWSFNDNKLDQSIDKTNLQTANNVYIQYSDQTTSYNLNWKYDSEIDSYVRYYENNKVDTDSLNNKITAKNVVIQFATTSVIPNDDKLRKEMNLTEGGKAIMIRNGYSVTGYWRKNSLINRTKFYTNINGVEKEFEFNPGKTWVNIVPKDYKIKID